MEKNINLFSVVIPVYNEEENIYQLYNRLKKVMDSLESSYEIIFVDDGSTDHSLAILKELKKARSSIRIISFKNNRGQSTALLAGFRISKGDWIITLDADLQNPPEEIPKLLRFKNNCAFITGIRRRRKDNFLKRVSSSIARFFRWLILKDTTKDTGCSLRMFKREIITQLFLFKNFHRFLTFLVRTKGFDVKEIPVEHHARRFGNSKYGILKRAKEGILDLVGVFWIKRRLMNYEVKYKA